MAINNPWKGRLMTPKLKTELLKIALAMREARREQKALAKNARQKPRAKRRKKGLK